MAIYQKALWVLGFIAIAGFPDAEAQNASKSTAISSAPTENWRRIEADNGSVYAVDLNSISHNTDGSAGVVACVVDNDLCIPPNITRLLFDCRGHYRDIDRGSSALLIVPPRSVVGRIAPLACAGAKDTRFVDDSERPDLSGTTPAQYCQDFPPDACARITAMIKGQIPAPTCRSGYGLVGSDYTPEQRRACIVIGRLRDAQPPSLVVASANPTPTKPGEIVIGQWSGQGNGRSHQFRVQRGPWEFRVSSSDRLSGGVYRVSDKTSISEFSYADGQQRSQQTSTGDFYFVVKTAGKWTISIVSFSNRP